MTFDQVQKTRFYLSQDFKLILDRSDWESWNYNVQKH